MEPTEYLKGIRRRWKIVAVVVVGALAGAWLSSTLGILTGGKRQYPATVSLVQRYNRSGGDGNVRSSAQAPSGTTSTLLISALVTTDSIVDRVAKKIQWPGDNDSLADRVTSNIEKSSGLLKITAETPKPERSKLVADTFASELIAFLIERDQQTLDATVKGLEAQIARLKTEVAALDKQIKKYPVSTLPVLPGVGGTRAGGTGSSGSSTGPLTSPADPFVAQRQAALQTLTSLSSQLNTTKAQTPDGEGLEVLQAATLDDSTAVIALPRSLGARLVVALILGLMAGVGLALIRERFDARIRTRDAVERHFGYPVLAEIPDVHIRGKNDVSLNPADLAPQVADAYRLLAAGLKGSRTGNGSGPGERMAKPRAILVTSAGPGSGKPAVLANLAGTLAEVGRTVTVVSCDFRHPDVPAAFGVANERGLAETLLSSNGGPLLNSCLHPTSASGVWVVPSGTATDFTSDQLLASVNMRRLLMEARQRSDLVLVDTSPILTSDPAVLLPEVDGVMVVVQAGTTKPELAERSSELLKRMGARVLGVVLIGNETAGLPRGYYKQSDIRHRILGSPRILLRGLGRALKSAPRVLKLARRSAKVVGSGIKTMKVPVPRRKESAEEPAVVDVRDAAPVAPAGSLATPKPPIDSGVQSDSGDAAPNGDRGFPRLMRRSDTR